MRTIICECGEEMKRVGEIKEPKERSGVKFENGVQYMPIEVTNGTILYQCPKCKTVIIK